MAEITTDGGIVMVMDNNGMFKLNLTDVARGVATAVFAGGVLAVLSVFQGVFSAPGFDLFTLDWSMVFHNLINAAAVGAEGGFVGYITKNFLSDEHGKLFGKI